MLGSRRRRAPRHQHQLVEYTTALVNARDQLVHLLTRHALTAGMRTGDYHALCGSRILPVPIVDALGRIASATSAPCIACRERTIPWQRQQRRLQRLSAPLRA